MKIAADPPEVEGPACGSGRPNGIGLSTVTTEVRKWDCPECWKRRRPLGIRNSIPVSLRGTVSPGSAETLFRQVSLPESVS
jgi:hypothetical protein